MKIYKTNDEVKADVKDGLLMIHGDVKFECHVDINANIKAEDIKAWNIKAWNINAWDIKAWNIKAEDIKALNIKALNIKAWDINADDIKAEYINAWDINAWDINAENIEAWNINARNINAEDIDAWNIKYYAFCVSYKNIKCTSITGKRKNASHKCLDGELCIKPKDHIITIDGKQIKLSDDSYKEFKKQFDKE